MPNMEELHQYDEGPQNNSNDDFLEQMLSIIPNCTWPPHPPSSNPNDPTLKPTASPPQDHAAAVAFPFSLPQPNNVGAAAAKSLLLQHQQLLLSRGFKPTADATQPGFVGSLHGNGQQQHFHPPPPPPPTAASTGGSSGGGAPQRQRVRARRGQATDPHSIAERLRRERIAERMKALQELVPNGNKTDKASMLDEIIDYVRFLQLQVKYWKEFSAGVGTDCRDVFQVLSMSRLGGAPAVAPQVTDMSSEGGGGAGLSSNGSLRNDNMTVTEHQVAKLMEEDMGSAMQYLQGKGLCLMPISLATAISIATCQPRDLSRTHDHHNNHSLLPFNPVDESPPNMSGLTVQSASAAAENTINNASKP